MPMRYTYPQVGVNAGYECFRVGGKIRWATKRIEYMCSCCGEKELRFVSMGKPQPGKCPRKQGDKPHSWVVNRKLEN